MGAVDMESSRSGTPIPSSEDGNEEIDGGRSAYLFRSGSWRAVTLDPTASDLPDRADGERWIFEKRFTLGIRNLGPGNISPETIVRGMLRAGYYLGSVWP